MPRIRSRSKNKSRMRSVSPVGSGLISLLATRGQFTDSKATHLCSLLSALIYGWIRKDTQTASTLAHNCWIPLWLPSHCSPDLCNGIWLLTTKTRLIRQNSKMFMIFSLKVFSERFGPEAYFQWIGPLGWFSHRVAMLLCVTVCDI